MSNILKPLETPLISLSSSYLAEPRPLVSDYTLYPEIYTHYSKSNVSAGLITSVKTILGSGLIFLPIILSSSGWVVGSLIIFFGFLFSLLTSNLLIECLINSPFPCSYHILVDSLNPHLTHLVSAAVIIDSFGASCTYLILVGKLLSNVIQSYGYSGRWTSEVVWIVIGFVFSIPLSFCKYLNSLRFISLFSLSAIIFLIIVQFLYTYRAKGFDPCSGQEYECKGTTKNFTECIDTLATIPIAIFAFNFHCNIFSITNEIENFSIKKLKGIVVSALLISLIIGFIVAVHPYFLYGNHLHDIFFFSYPSK